MTLPMILVGALAFVAVIALGSLFGGQQTDQRTLKRIREQVRGTADKRADINSADTAKRRQNNQTALKNLAEEEKNSRKRRISVAGQLNQAGLKFTTAHFWIAAAVLGAILALVGFFIKGLIGAAVGAFIGGFGLPRWILGSMVTGRQKKFVSQFPDGIDMIVRGVKSGLPLTQCMRMIASESPEPLRSEFQHVIDGQAMGVPFEANLQRMYERMPLHEVNFFGIVLIIQQKTGGNLSESLFNLSTVLRSRKLMKEKVKALSGEAVASAGVIGSLPFIIMTLVYMVRPAYMSILFEETAGHVILLIAACMMSLGIFVMRKMINFKF
jgi:tight adherence protein B